MKMKGYVTTWASIEGHGARNIEKRLGFKKGLLRLGYSVWQLDDDVGRHDFIWHDKTMYSGGWHHDYEIGQYVQVRDELRAHFGRQVNYDEKLSDDKIDDFMNEQCRQLQVRTGPGRIVRVETRHRFTDYPDSELYGIPQWQLIKPKKFTHMFTVSGE